MRVEIVAAGAVIVFLGTTLCVLGALVKDDGAGDRLALFDAHEVVDAVLVERALLVASTQAGAVETASAVRNRKTRLITGLSNIQEIRVPPGEDLPKLTSAAGVLYIMQNSDLVGDKYVLALAPLLGVSVAPPQPPPPPPLTGKRAAKDKLLLDLSSQPADMLGAALRKVPGWFTPYASKPAHLQENLLRRPELITHLFQREHAALEGPRAFVVGSSVEQNRELWDLFGGILYHELGQDRHSDYVLNVNDALRASTGANFFRLHMHVQKVFATSLPIPPPEDFFHSENCKEGSDTKGSVGVCLDPERVWRMKMMCPAFRDSFGGNHTIVLTAGCDGAAHGVSKRDTCVNNSVWMANTGTPQCPTQVLCCGHGVQTPSKSSPCTRQPSIACLKTHTALCGRTHLANGAGA